MTARRADAEWQGDLRSGKGQVSLGSGAYSGPYSFRSRFESGDGTNPEELIGAAHAGCFSMALAAGLSAAGHTPSGFIPWQRSTSNNKIAASRSLVSCWRPRRGRRELMR